MLLTELFLSVLFVAPFPEMSASFFFVVLKNRVLFVLKRRGRCL